MILPAVAAVSEQVSVALQGVVRGSLRFVFSPSRETM